MNVRKKDKMHRAPFPGNDGGSFNQRNNGPGFMSYPNGPDFRPPVTQHRPNFGLPVNQNRPNFGPSVNQNRPNLGNPMNQPSYPMRPPNKLNMVWNMHPGQNGPPRTLQGWGPASPRPQFQNGPRTLVQYGSMDQVGPGMNFDGQNRGDLNWHYGQRGIGPQNEENWQKRTSINVKNDGRNMNQNKWQNNWKNGNQANHAENRQSGKWKQNRPNNKNKNRKEKVNKRDLEENNQYFCDTCDRGFKTEEKYKEHTDSHEQCHVEGCTYVAATKLVQLHYRLQHSTGLAKKIWQLESKEDIEKWRNERKRNYPTAENIARKNKTLEDRKARGEVLETKEFGKFRKRQQGRNRQENQTTDNDNEQQEDGGRKNYRRNRRQRHRNNKRKRMEKEEDGDTSPTKKSKVDNENNPSSLNNSSASTHHKSDRKDEKKNLMSDPLSYGVGDDDLDKDLDDGDMTNHNNMVTKSDASGDNSALPALQGGLGSIQMMYGSDSDSECEGEAGIEDSSKSPKSAQVEKKISPVKEISPVKPKPKRRKKKDLFYRKGRMTLLEKLLANEIRQERNKILQCVHHIVKHNFLEWDKV